ncbi:MAG: response regulator [Acidobacteria bacterium]|nr:response regulator [Acidobacteriota bacterium]
MITARALIVDDDETILRVVSAYLNRNDAYEVLTASSPQAALEIVRSAPVDLLISDIMMPGILGTRLFQEIKQISPNTVCILISGYEKEMYNLPSDMVFLKKPFGADELFSTIEKATEQ